MVKAFSPDFVAPVVGYLTSSANETTQGLYEISGGWVAAVRWQRTYGYAVSFVWSRSKGSGLTRYAQFPVNKHVTPEDVKAKWDIITRFDEKATNPNSASDSFQSVRPSVSLLLSQR